MTKKNRVKSEIKRSSVDGFPGRLREARQLRKLSQHELAARAKVTPSIISHFETGSRKPSLHNFRQLADALDVTTDYLIGRTTDTFHRDLDRLTSDDRDLANSILKILSERNKKNTRRDGE